MTSILRRAFISISVWRFGGVLAREADAKRVPAMAKRVLSAEHTPGGMPLSHHRGGKLASIIAWFFPPISSNSSLTRSEIEVAPI